AVLQRRARPVGGAKALRGASLLQIPVARPARQARPDAGDRFAETMEGVAQVAPAFGKRREVEGCRQARPNRLRLDGKGRSRPEKGSRRRATGSRQLAKGPKTRRPRKTKQPRSFRRALRRQEACAGHGATRPGDAGGSVRGRAESVGSRESETG